MFALVRLRIYPKRAECVGRMSFLLVVYQWNRIELIGIVDIQSAVTLFHVRLSTIRNLSETRQLFYIAMVLTNKDCSMEAFLAV